jgi:hypothetical protein
MNRERIYELVFLYISNSISDSELSELNEAIVEFSEEVSNIFAEVNTTDFLLSTGGSLEYPSPLLKEKLFSELRNRNNPAHLDVTAHLFTDQTKIKFAYGIAVVMFLVTLIIGYNYSLLNKQSSFQEKRIFELTNEVAQKQSLLDVLVSKSVQLVSMNGLEPSPASYGKIIWSEDRKTAILQISKLPSIQKDKDYQLWAIENGTPVSWGVFSISISGSNAFFKLEEVKTVSKKSINAFAITLEPKGGVPQPTGKMYLLGKANS